MNPETRARRLYAAVIEPIRVSARSLGYAVAVHGSLSRDVDLIAVPWTDDAANAVDLYEAVRQAIENTTGVAFLNPRIADDPFHQSGCPRIKPHGRLTWAINSGYGTYVDLSVMPIIHSSGPPRIQT